MVAILKQSKTSKQINKQKTKGVIEEINWSLGANSGSIRSINKPEINFVVNTDASESGWRATNGRNTTRVNFSAQNTLSQIAGDVAGLHANKN